MLMIGIYVVYELVILIPLVQKLEDFGKANNAKFHYNCSNFVIMWFLGYSVVLGIVQLITQDTSAHSIGVWSLAGKS